MTQTAQAPAPTPPVRSSISTPLRYRGVGSVVLSSDFLASIPIGGILGFLAGQFDRVGDGAPTILIAYMGALVALAAVVIAAHTLLITLMTPEYLALVERARGGVSGVSRPYMIVATVCACGALASLAAALVWPLVPDGYSWSRGLIFGACTFLTSWGLFGSTQLIGLGAFHLEQRASLVKILRDLRRSGDQP